MAVWRATGGTQAGWMALDCWSARNAAYDPQETRKRWDHYFKSPPTKIGAGSIFFLAKEAREPPPNTQRGTAAKAAARASGSSHIFRPVGRTDAADISDRCTATGPM